jgi:hypothetical protein
VILLGAGVLIGFGAIAGVLIGVYLFTRPYEHETEPATDAPLIAAGLTDARSLVLGSAAGGRMPHDRIP